MYFKCRFCVYGDRIMVIVIGLKFCLIWMLFILVGSKLILLEILVEFYFEKCYGVLNYKCGEK